MIKYENHCCACAVPGILAKEYLKEVFEDLTISEQAEVLDVLLKKLED